MSGCSREDKLRKYIVCNVLPANAMLLEKSSAHHSWNTYDARTHKLHNIFFGFGHLDIGGRKGLAEEV